jgi:hypothetical protein
MKKLLLIIAAIVVLCAVLFASPIIGKVDKGETKFFGTAHAGEGGGGGI